MMRMGERTEKEGALREAAVVFGVELEAATAKKMVTLMTMVGRANERLRLTAITTWEEALAKHLLDSLAPLALGLSPAPMEPVADLGSGGGFPGLVLAIVLPGVSFTLIEATRKKAAFLTAAAEELGLGNVRVWAVRAE
ncbi:MAG: 16S rRNA (guanine(527)-N(7))-methyltransferase RsmG, partial [Firmicutes bacterium]|nr:16S rRNA (guanine(527)-N(7))-methyltransferase RsmG [Bacillota bacterium]